MEAEINSFTRKSKKYRTKYFDQLDKLFGELQDGDKQPKEGDKFEHSEAQDG